MPCRRKLRLRASLFQDWSSDPFSRGCYSVPSPGSFALRARLAEPEGRLFFAGEAVGGYVHGEFRSATMTAALLSGRDAAKKVTGAVRAARH